MLVLSRRADESVIVDGQIKVTVLDIRGRTVRLGIEAPKSTPVYREELQKQLAEKASGVKHVA